MTVLVLVDVPRLTVLVLVAVPRVTVTVLRAGQQNRNDEPALGPVGSTLIPLGQVAQRWRPPIAGTTTALASRGGMARRGAPVTVLTLVTVFLNLIIVTGFCPRGAQQHPELCGWPVR